MNLEPDPLLVVGVVGQYTEWLKGKYEYVDGVTHNNKSLFQKINVDDSKDFFLRYQAKCGWTRNGSLSRS